MENFGINEYLSVLSKELDTSAFLDGKLNGLAGLSPPNEFTVKDLWRTLIEKNLSLDECDEYCWAITESFDDAVFDEIEDCFFIIYIASLYLYCDAKKPFGVELSSYYIRKSLECLWHDKTEKQTNDFYQFLSSLESTGNVSVEYFSLLGMLFIERFLNVVKPTSFEQKSTRLKEIRDHAINYIDLSDSESCRIGWLELNKKLPEKGQLSITNFNRILFS